MDLDYDYHKELTNNMYHDRYIRIIA